MQKAVYRWILDPEDREAVILHIAIKKTPILDYRAIIEISCIYSPEELLPIKRAYQNRYKHSLEEDLAQHTSGDIRKVCNTFTFKNYNYFSLKSILFSFFFFGKKYY